jgi:hypothetical protein
LAAAPCLRRSTPTRAGRREQVELRDHEQFAGSSASTSRSFGGPHTRRRSGAPRRLFMKGIPGNAYHEGLKVDGILHVSMRHRIPSKQRARFTLDEVKLLLLLV